MTPKDVLLSDYGWGNKTKYTKVYHTGGFAHYRLSTISLQFVETHLKYTEELLTHDMCHAPAFVCLSSGRKLNIYMYVQQRILLFFVQLGLSILITVIFQKFIF